MHTITDSNTLPPFRIVSSTLGRPVILRDEEIDVPLPSHLDDDQFNLSQPLPPSEPSLHGDVGEQTSPFLHLIRIRRLSGQILSLFYNNRRCADVPVEEKRLVRRRFSREIRAWRDDTRHLNLHKVRGERNGLSSFTSPEWYEAVYNNAILLLYRPSPYLPQPTTVLFAEDGEPDLVVLLNAAEGSIKAYSELHKKRQLNYSWTTLHGVFLAGLTYIYCIERILRGQRGRGLASDVFNIIETTRACSNILVAICERWNATRRSCELFDKLTNVIIREALNVSTSQNGDGGQRPTGNPSGASHMQEDTLVQHSTQHRNFEQRQRQRQRGQQQQQIQLQDIDSNPSQTPDPMGPILQFDNIPATGIDDFRQPEGSLDMANHHDHSAVSDELVSGFWNDWSFDGPWPGHSDLDNFMHGMRPDW